MLNRIKKAIQANGLKAVVHEGTVSYVCVFGGVKQLAAFKAEFPQATEASDFDVTMASIQLGNVDAGLRVNL